VTADTIVDEQFGIGTQGWNRYSYVKNNPIIYKDPTGRRTFTVTRDLDVNTAAPTPGVHSFNVTLSQNPAKEYGKEFSDKFKSIKLEKDAFGYKKGETVFYRIMSGAGGKGDKDPAQEWKLLKTTSNPNADRNAQSTYKADEAAFKEIATGKKSRKTQWDVINPDTGEKSTIDVPLSWNTKSYEMLKGGKRSSELDKDIMRAYDSYDNKANYPNYIFNSGYTCHSLTKTISERGGATNYPKNLDGISPGDNRTIPDKYFTK
jgi:hypothetical protein